MSDADSDSVSERLATVEATLDQIDRRFERVETDTDQLRADLRRWFVAMFVGLRAVIGVVQFPPV